MKIEKGFTKKNKCTLYHWDSLDFIKTLPTWSVDLTFTSPPYCIGKEYEKWVIHYESFIEAHKEIFPEIIRVTKEGWSICWQIGYHVNKDLIMPLDRLIYDTIRPWLNKEIFLRNRIVRTFWHGLHNSHRFSGRHEIVLWFTKWKKYNFDLDKVRVPQKYPGKKYSKWEKKGEYSWNPLWKNPSDIWDIPNVKANHVEKTEHPCQFPVALVQRFIKSLVPKNGLVFDPYMWSWTTWVAALIEKKRFVWSEIDKRYCKIAIERCKLAEKNEINYRCDCPVYIPGNESVAKKPDYFKF